MDTPPEGLIDPIELAEQVKTLEREVRRLKDSDRRQWSKLRAQQRWSMVFAGIVAVGVAVFTDGLSAENRDSLENAFIGATVAVMGGVGVAGVTSKQFRPPGHDYESGDEGADDADED